ncbi:hypothetical protein [Clostridium sp.]|uniref:hypothetical protein n=1 Tax=Clostridium sp. TaxID=1506 RepID=UPI001A48F49E|nr:hypothetical protein [Clostridium sp.]MBK5240645.1 hypothetical protein [Clostridium sp.]
MIRLVCEKCDHIWYTSNTSINQKCDECGEILIELGIEAKDIENTPEVVCSGNNVTIGRR